MFTQDEKLSELNSITSTVASRSKINPELYNKYNVKRGLRNNDGTGVLVGLGLYALGALLFWPAKMIGVYPPFLIAYFILTCGLSFLETS